MRCDARSPGSVRPLTRFFDETGLTEGGAGADVRHAPEARRAIVVVDASADEQWDETQEFSHAAGKSHHQWLCEVEPGVVHDSRRAPLRHTEHDEDRGCAKTLGVQHRAGRAYLIGEGVLDLVLGEQRHAAVTTETRTKMPVETWSGRLRFADDDEGWWECFHPSGAPDLTGADLHPWSISPARTARRSSTRRKRILRRGSLDEALDEGGGRWRELDSGQRTVDDRQLRRDVSEVDVVEHRHRQITQGVHERIVLTEMTGGRAGRAADKHGVGAVEPAGEAQVVQHPRRRDGVRLGDLDVDEQTLPRVSRGEVRNVAVRHPTGLAAMSHWGTFTGTLTWRGWRLGNQRWEWAAQGCEALASVPPLPRARR